MFSGRSGGAAAAAALALALAPALSAMRRGSGDRELALRREAAAAEPVVVDAGAAGEPEHKAAEEQPKVPGPEQPRAAAEEGDAGVSPLPPLARAPHKPEEPEEPPARDVCPPGKPRSKGRSGKRSSHGDGSQRPVTVDSSKAKTSLDALKISIRQLKWKEVRHTRGWGAGGQAPGQLGGPGMSAFRANRASELRKPPRSAHTPPAAVHSLLRL